MAPDTFVNGINVDQLLSTIDQIKKNPDIADFTFRTTNKWVEGTHNRATVKDFYGALQEDATREPLVFEIDEPPVLGGKNVGANPVEYLLVALSGCLTTTLVANAATKGIKIKGIQSRLEGKIDLRGFLGLSKDVKVGYEEIRVFFSIDADISEEQKQELIQAARKYSPVANTIFNATPVSVQLEKEHVTVTA